MVIEVALKSDFSKSQQNNEDLGFDRKDRVRTEKRFFRGSLV